MKVSYVGPLEAVEHAQQIVKKGESIDVDDATGVQLVAQGWKPVAEPKAEKAKTRKSQED